MLPTMTSPEDVIAIVDYLKTKATGATFEDARAALDSRMLDGRKLTAYEFWGFMIREGERLKLTPDGRRLARANEEQRSACFGDIIRRIRAYSLAIDWIFHQRFSVLTSVELAAHWHEHLPGDVGTDNESTMRYQVVCFFQLAAAAGLGSYSIGRRGQPTRFEPDRDALGQFIAENVLTGSSDSGEAGTIIAGGGESDSSGGESLEAVVVDGTIGLERRLETREEPPEPSKTRVFISHGENEDVVDQLKTMLDLADLDYEVAVEEETTAIPVPEKVLSAMHQCTAAVICVTADDNMRREDGSYRVNDNVLIEIGAAFVLYDRRVVLVWDRRIDVPSNLQGLYRCEFEGNELSWSAGMKLMKAVTKFKKST